MEIADFTQTTQAFLSPKTTSNPHQQCQEEQLPCIPATISYIEKKGYRVVQGSTWGHTVRTRGRGAPLVLLEVMVLELEVVECPKRLKEVIKK